MLHVFKPGTMWTDRMVLSIVQGRNNWWILLLYMLLLRCDMLDFRRGRLSFRFDTYNFRPDRLLYGRNRLKLVQNRNFIDFRCDPLIFWFFLHDPLIFGRHPLCFKHVLDVIFRFWDMFLLIKKRNLLILRT